MRAVSLRLGWPMLRKKNSILFPTLHSVLGSLDSSGNQLHDQYSIRGVINLWGGIADTSLISQQEMKTTPVILFHSTTDQLIPYERSTHPEASFRTFRARLM